MTTQDLIALRNAIGMTQAELARAIGLSTRAYQDIESSGAPVKLRHQLAIERIALDEAADQGNPTLAPASIRRSALKLASVITEG